MRKSIYLFTTIPSSHTHRFHPLPLATPILHSTNSPQLSSILLLVPYFELCTSKSMDDNCGEWVECMGVVSGCGEQEVGVASGSGWNLWVWLLGVVVRRYRFPHTTYPYSSCICSFLQQHPYFLFTFFNVFRSCSSTFW